MKKLLWGLGIGSVILIVAAFLLGRYAFPNTLASLPTPELSEGQRGELGIDKNVNEKSVYNVINSLYKLGADVIYDELAAVRKCIGNSTVGFLGYFKMFHYIGELSVRCLADTA